MKIVHGITIVILFIVISILCIKFGFGSTTSYNNGLLVPNFEYITSTEANVKEHEKRIYAVEEEILILKARMELYSDIINDIIKENNELKNKILKLEKKKR